MVQNFVNNSQSSKSIGMNNKHTPRQLTKSSNSDKMSILNTDGFINLKNPFRDADNQHQNSHNSQIDQAQCSLMHPKIQFPIDLNINESTNANNCRNYSQNSRSMESTQNTQRLSNIYHNLSNMNKMTG